MTIKGVTIPFTRKLPLTEAPFLNYDWFRSLDKKNIYIGVVSNGGETRNYFAVLYKIPRFCQFRLNLFIKMSYIPDFEKNLIHRFKIYDQKRFFCS